MRNALEWLHCRGRWRGCSIEGDLGRARRVSIAVAKEAVRRVGEIVH